ncbi:MAG: DUF3795 domain-containing protein [Candidatus Bathyarchaeia archaeon]
MDAHFIYLWNEGLKATVNPELIAPCGMNCALCSGYLALKNDVKSKGVRMSYCTSCRPRNKNCSFLKKKMPNAIKQRSYLLF